MHANILNQKMKHYKCDIVYCIYSHLYYKCFTGKKNDPIFRFQKFRKCYHSFLELYLKKTWWGNILCLKTIRRDLQTSVMHSWKKVPKNFCLRKLFSIITWIPQIAGKAHFPLLALDRKEMNNFSSYLWTMFKLFPSLLCSTLNNSSLPERFFKDVTWNYHCSLLPSLQSLFVSYRNLDSKI